MRWIFAAVALGLTAGAAIAQAETWSGCVRVANTSNRSVTVTLDAYPNQRWDIPASYDGLKFLETSDDKIVILTGDSSSRPPLHVQPSNIPILWNFFTGEHDQANTCANTWHIAVSIPVCNAIDNVCP